MSWLRKEGGGSLTRVAKLILNTRIEGKLHGPAGRSAGLVALRAPSRQRFQPYASASRLKSTAHLELLASHTGHCGNSQHNQSSAALYIPSSTDRCINRHQLHSMATFASTYPSCSRAQTAQCRTPAHPGNGTRAGTPGIVTTLRDDVSFTGTARELTWMTITPDKRALRKLIRQVRRACNLNLHST